MFSIAAAAAAQAAVTPPRPPPPRKRPVKKRNSTSSRSSSTSNSKNKNNKAMIPPSSIVVDYEQQLGIRPILKRSNTLATERGDMSERSTSEDTTIASCSASSLAAMDTSNSSRSLRRGVSFSTVEIREYIVQLGDSPFCEGPPICLSNERQDECIIDALKFDEMRCRDRRGDLQFFRLSAPKRFQLLLALGYSMDDIVTVTIETDQNRRELMLSLQNKKWDYFNAIKESAIRRMKRLVQAGGDHNHSSGGTPPLSPEQDTATDSTTRRTSSRHHSRHSLL